MDKDNNILTNQSKVDDAESVKAEKHRLHLVYTSHERRQINNVK